MQEHEKIAWMLRAYLSWEPCLRIEADCGIASCLEGRTLIAPCQGRRPGEPLRSRRLVQCL